MKNEVNIFIYVKKKKAMKKAPCGAYSCSVPPVYDTFGTRSQPQRSLGLPPALTFSSEANLLE